MTRARTCLALGAFMLVASPRGASAEAPLAPLSAENKDEARRRFDRGLALYNDGDLSGALVEFKLAYKLTSHPVVLYNLALVHAALGNAAEAVESLERLQSPEAAAQLGEQRVERARRVLQEQLLRVGTLEVKTNVPRTLVQVDSIDVARTPAEPVRITAGTHVVSLSAAQHEPRRLSVTVAGRAREVLEVELTPVEEALAHLTADTPVPEVEVRANGQLLGRTPFASDLAFKPGSYELEFSRQGYVPVRRHIMLHAGSVGHVDVPMVPSDAGLATGGLLEFSLSESDTVVTVDGQPRLDHTRGLRLPLGRHALRIQRAGFFDVEREVWVRPGRQTIDARLLPTPLYLRDYVESARSQRFWSYLSMGTGALVAAGGAGFLLWNQGQKNEAQREFDAYADAVASSESGECDDAACEQELGVLVDELDARRQRDVFGWAGVAVGAAALGAGVVLYLKSPDPYRYEPRPESDVFAKLKLRLAGPSLSLHGEF